MEIVDQKIKFEEIENVSSRRLIVVKGEFLKKLIQLSDIPEFKGLNREVKLNDWIMKRDISRLSIDPDYFLKERTITINERNLHIIDGQHTRMAALIFMEKHPELADNFKVCLELLNIPTMEEEERIIKERQIARCWVSFMFFENGLASLDKNKRENYIRYQEVIDYLMYNFSHEKLKKTKLVSIAGYSLGISNPMDVIKRQDKLIVSEGNVIDSKALIDYAFRLEKAAMKNKYSTFSLTQGKFWIVFRTLFKSISYFDVEKFIKYVEDNSYKMDWWNGDKSPSMSFLRRVLYKEAYKAKTIKESDYIFLFKRYKL